MRRFVVDFHKKDDWILVFGRTSVRIQKVYLETTMFNYYFDKTRNAQPSTVAFMAGYREILISQPEEVINNEDD